MSHTRKELCGCKIGLFPEPVECTVCHQINPVDHYTLEYCPLHAAAPELLEAIEQMIPWVGKLIADDGHLKSVRPQAAVEALKLAEKAKAHAEGKE